ncbi:MAG: cytochrome c biogenesis protein, partial [Myxococcota bacterium]
MGSTLFYNLCAAGYATALFLYIFNLAGKRARVRKAATVTTSLAFLMQTVGMLFRWHEAGLVEVAAVERAQDIKLGGASYFVIYSQHPPWSNLYEIMVFMAWGVVLVYLVSEVKWRIRLAGVFSLVIALTSLGLASLTTDATIKPLVPALQSWWIMIHVISSAVGYACGVMGAVLSLLFLVKAKERVSLNAVGAGTLFTSALVFLVLGRGFELLTTAEYRVKLLGTIEGQLETVGRVVDGRFHPYYVPSPLVGQLLFLSVVLCLAGGIFLSMRRGDNGGTPRGKTLYAFLAAFVVSLATVGLIVVNAFTQTDVQLPPEVAQQLTHGAPPPWRLHIASAQWDLALFGIMVGAQLFIALAMLFPERMRGL